jgi:hypothetical protein
LWRRKTGVTSNSKWKYKSEERYIKVENYTLYVTVAHDYKKGAPLTPPLATHIHMALLTQSQRGEKGIAKSRKEVSKKRPRLLHFLFTVVYSLLGAETSHDSRAASYPSFEIFWFSEQTISADLSTRRLIHKSATNNEENRILKSCTRERIEKRLAK